MGKEATRVRRRERKNIASGIAHVNSSFNNTTITITDEAATQIRGVMDEQGEGLALHLPPAGGDHAIQHRTRQGVAADQVVQRPGHLMRSCRPRGGIRHHVAPPLQPHRGDQRLIGHPRGARDFQVEGIEREQLCPHLGRGGHRGHKAVGVAAFDQRRAGRDRHAGAPTSRISFHWMASSNASNEASTMFALTPTVDQRRP